VFAPVREDYLRAQETRGVDDTLSSTLATGYNPGTSTLEAIAMPVRQYLRDFVWIAALCAGTDACSSGSATANLPHFNDITSASPEIQTAARAVVRVRTAGE